MRFDRNALHAAGLAAAMLSTGAARADNSPFGVWIDHTGRGAVEITDCSGKLCGRVAWVKDAENGEECGKQIIGNVKPVGTNKWDNGWIYDPDRGKKYDVEVTALDGDKLRVKGYAGSKWLSETYTWKRAPADLQKCTTGQAAQAATPAAAAQVTSPAATEPKTPPAATAQTAPPAAAKPVETAKSSPDTKAPVELNAANAEAGNRKPDAGKQAPTARDDADQPDTTAKAEPNDEEGEEPSGNDDGGKVIAHIMDELENGDGPVKLKRVGNRCNLNVPYVDMVVSFRCDKNE